MKKERNQEGCELSPSPTESDPNMTLKFCCCFLLLLLVVGKGRLVEGSVESHAVWE